MNWEAAGAIGEIVGAIAVVATLLYFSIQMRESRASMERQGTLGSASRHAEWRQAVMANSDLAVVMAKANNGETLNNAEVILLKTMAEDLFVAGVAAYANIADAGAIHDTDGEFEYMANMLIDNPALETNWKRFKYVIDKVSAEYGAGVERYLQKMKAETHAKPKAAS